MSRPSLIGIRVPRIEDDRLLTGRGSYVADIALPDAVEVAIVRSQFSHGHITAIDSEEARGSPGVLGVYTAADLVDVQPFPDFYEYARPVKIFPLQRDRVRYVGAPVAAVVAEDRYLAEDARQKVLVDIEPLDALASIEAAMAPDAVRLFDDWPDNNLVHVPIREDKEIDAVFERCRTIGGRFTIQRHTGVPIETRGVVAEFRDGRLTVWSTTQFPHIARTMLSYVLPLAEEDIRVIAPDIGGGFGIKAEFYPEEVLVSWLAMKLGRPVRWIEDRYEHFVASAHARDEVIDMEAAVEEDGTVVALRGTVYQDAGSGEIYPAGFNPSFVLAGSLTGPYKIPLQSVGVTAVVTNKTPSGAYRGFGIPEAAFVMERLLDKAAGEIGMDRAEIRRKNLLDSDDLPFTTASGAMIDSGSHREAFERIVALTKERVEYHRSMHAADDRVHIGSGIANYVEGVTPQYFGTSGHWTTQDSCALTVNPDGTVLVSSGVSTAGQGLASMLATLTAESLGVGLEDVRVVIGDTDRAPYGLGGWGSRSTNVAAGALERAAKIVRDKGIRIASHMLEAAPADIEIDAGSFHVKGSDQPAVTWAQIGTAANVRTFELPPGEDPGLQATEFYDPPGVDVDVDENGKGNFAASYTNATHAAIVKVDVGSGEVKVIEFLIAHDCGVVINPLIVSGQVHGGVAQGIGGALYEELFYSDEATPMATSFLDYHMPTAAEVPPMLLEHFESPAPDMAFGAKGAGEAGIIGPAPAIAAAVEDALADFGIANIASTPIAPPFVRRLLREAASS